MRGSLGNKFLSFLDSLENEGLLGKGGRRYCVNRALLLSTTDCFSGAAETYENGKELAM